MASEDTELMELILERLDRMDGRLAALEGQSYDFAPPGPFSFGTRSLSNLSGVHPDLLACAHYALRVTKVDFAVTWGLRTAAQQKAIFDRGRSWTLDSRHRTGHAVDTVAWVNGAADWDLKPQIAVHDAFEQAAEALQVNVRWGGDWDEDGDTEDEKRRDAYHHELKRAEYGEIGESPDYTLEPGVFEPFVHHSERARVFLFQVRGYYP